MSEPAFKLGETVFYVYASPYAETRVPCPVCFGKRSVVIILGNGESQPVECEFCQRGWEGPQGFINASAPSSSVCESEIKGIRQEAGQWEYEVGYHERKRASELFRTREEAEAVRVVLHAEAEKQAEERNVVHANHGKKKLTWLVGYHRRERDNAKRQMEHHERKLSETKDAAKKERSATDA